VAWAEEAALPVWREARTRAGRQLGCGGTAKVGTDAHRNEIFRIARTVLVFGVFRCEARALRVWVSKPGIKLGQGSQLSLRTAQNPHGPAAPFNGGHLARLQRADVDFN